MEAYSQNEDWQPWYERFGPRLLLCARQWTKSQADAEDVVQEAFVRFWKHQRNIAGDNPFPLLVTSVRRAAVDQARQSGRRKLREEQAAVEAATESSWFLPGESDRVARLETALVHLPEEQREVVVLKIWGELTFAEIAETLAIPPATAASRYRYALQAMREFLNPVSAS